jgi:rod shape-determining protein MreC
VATVTRAFSRRDTIMFAACVVLAIVAQALPDNLRDPFAAGLRRTVIAPLVSLQQNAEESRRAWITREERTWARDSVVLRSLQLESVSSENERLRRLLGLGAQLKWGFAPAEVLQGRGVGEEYTVVLSAGGAQGVKVFSPIVAPDGIVGMVKSVDPTMSIGIVWAHPDFRVSAMAADQSVYGIVAAHLGNESERYMLELRGVPLRGSLKPGTLVVSSGIGGVFPRGIPIGTVISEIKTPERWAHTYLLRPSVQPSDMSNVLILSPQRSPGQLDGIWSGTNADSLASADSGAARPAIDGRATAAAKPSGADTTATRKARRGDTTFVSRHRADTAAVRTRRGESSLTVPTVATPDSATRSP